MFYPNNVHQNNKKHNFFNPIKKKFLKKKFLSKMVTFYYMSNEYEEDDDNAFLMNENDPKHIVTVESILERLTRCLVSNEYGEADYWDQRYSESPEEYEWFMSWKYIFPFIQEYIKPNKIALNEGCGNSPMSYEMIS